MNTWVAWIGALSPVLLALFGWWTARNVRALNARLALKTSAEERQIETSTYAQLQEQVRTLWKERTEHEAELAALQDALQEERDCRRVCEELMASVSQEHANEIRGLKLRIAKLEKRLREAGLPLPNGDTHA